MRSLFLCFFTCLLFAGEYDPKADPKADLAAALSQANKEGKHVLIQVGGDWCPWCLKLIKFFKAQEEIASYLDNNFIFLNVNYSKENKNLDFLKSLGYPQRFGFPVLLVFNAEGERLHTQNTVFLEKDKGYSQERVLAFLKNWSPEALDPQNYK